MAFKKGQSGNPAGKPKGVKSKSVETLRNTLNDFLHANLPSIQKEFNKLDSRDKLDFINKILAYSLPKLQSVSMDAEFDFKQLSDSDLDRIINKIIKND
jgi:hypothetical protein